MIYEYTFIAISVLLSYLIIRPCHWQGLVFRIGLALVCLGFIGASSSVDNNPIELIRSFNVICYGLLVCGVAILLWMFKGHRKCHHAEGIDQ